MGVGPLYQSIHTFCGRQKTFFARWVAKNGQIRPGIDFLAFEINNIDMNIHIINKYIDISKKNGNLGSIV
jgi:hypothetical protein